MKQSVLIASVLTGGALAGAVGVVMYQSLKPATTRQEIAVTPHTQASAPVSLAAAPISPPTAQGGVPAPISAAPPAPSVANPPAPPPAPVHDRYARILSVKAIREPVTEPRQVCHAEQYQREAPVQDSNRVAGTVVGGLLGGVLGNQIGSGRGNTAATVAGALAGGYAGNKVQQNLQQRDLVTDTRTVCNTEDVPVEKTVGYTVRYSLDGRIGTVRMDNKPHGKTLPARNGELLVTN